MKTGLKEEVDIMTTWKGFKKEITAISPQDMVTIETLSHLIAVRVQRGITQKEFAAHISMSQPQLAKLERLDSMPSLRTLQRYANGLNLKIELTVVPA
jgi:DNA-binding XRE family transcriptional regulator